MLSCALYSEIFEITMNVGKIDCKYCVEEIDKTLRAIPQITNVEIFPHADIISIEWNKNDLFYACFPLTAFSHSKFKPSELQIDFQGFFYKERDKNFLKTQNGSVFYIDHSCDSLFTAVQEGDALRVKGIVKNSHGFNFLTIREIVWKNDVQNRITQLPASVQFSQ